jgi:hypothetical protein
MTSGEVAIYLGLGILLAILVALWARACGRNPVVWGLITLFMTPFAFLFVAVALGLRGRRRSPADQEAVRQDP